MNSNKFLKIIKIAAMGLLFVALVAWLVMGLWNWLMPFLFNAKVITYWQAMGLLVLCKILFGGVKGAWGHRQCNQYDKGYWKDKLESRMANMSDEEREKFKQQFYNKCKDKWGCDWQEK